METMKKTAGVDVEDTRGITDGMAIIGASWVTRFP